MSREESIKNLLSSSYEVPKTPGKKILTALVASTVTALVAGVVFGSGTLVGTLYLYIRDDIRTSQKVVQTPGDTSEVKKVSYTPEEPATPGYLLELPPPFEERSENVQKAEHAYY